LNELAFDPAGNVVRWYDFPGRGPARIFIHGLGCGGGAWTFWKLVGHPALGGHRSLVIDLPGHGMSDRPVDWSYSLDDHASVVARICEAVAVDGVDLVGHSMGGDIGVVVAARYAGIVGRLVVAEPNLDPLPPSSTGRMSQRIAAQSETAFIGRGYDELVASEVLMRPMLRLSDPRAVYRSAVSLITQTSPTTREMLLAMDIPRTFIRGELGETIREADGLRAAGVETVTIPRAGHFMMHDAADAFASAISAALGD
jgi:pimeloyl-ACP methyl ester carboxylesterase